MQRTDLRTTSAEISQGYMSISRDLRVPLSNVHNITKKLTIHGTVASLINDCPNAG